MPNFMGAVTIPHKMPIAELCDELGEVARITGAVNAIRFEEGRLKGDNFDGAGFVTGLYDQGHSQQTKMPYHWREGNRRYRLRALS